MVDGKAISGSHYRSYDDLQVNVNIPASVLDFAEQLANTWSPAPVLWILLNRKDI
jgi:hypothetical protein